MFTALVAPDPPVILPVTDGANQLYKVPAGTVPFVISVGVNVNSTPLQLTVVMAVMLAFGFRLTVKLNGAPKQLPV